MEENCGISTFSITRTYAKITNELMHLLEMKTKKRVLSVEGNVAESWRRDEHAAPPRWLKKAVMMIVVENKKPVVGVMFEGRKGALRATCLLACNVFGEIQVKKSHMALRCTERRSVRFYSVAEPTPLRKMFDVAFIVAGIQCGWAIQHSLLTPYVCLGMLPLEGEVTHAARKNCVKQDRLQTLRIGEEKNEDGRRMKKEKNKERKSPSPTEPIDPTTPSITTLSVEASQAEPTPLRKMFDVAFIVAGIQCGWAIQHSLLTPYVQFLRLSHAATSLIWLCGPVSGLVVQPIVGYYSDRSTSRFGRRRPFILRGAVAVAIAEFHISYAADIGYDDITKKTCPWAVGVFVIGFGILHVANNMLQGHCRAFLADLAAGDQRKTRIANGFFSFFIGVGNVLGFTAASFSGLDKTFPFMQTKACDVFCANLKSSYFYSILLLVFLASVALIYVKEKPVLPRAVQEDAQPSAPSPTEPIDPTTPSITTLSVEASQAEPTPLRKMFDVAFIAAGIQCGWAIQHSLLTPYVQFLGVPHATASLIWLCGPVSEHVEQPIIGYYSDRSTSRFGRRRPFILRGAVVVAIAEFLISYAVDIGYDDITKKTRPWAVGVFVIGFGILHVANNMLQGPCRAFLADLVAGDQRKTRIANGFFSFFIGVGNVLGFAAASFSGLDKTFPFTQTKFLLLLDLVTGVLSHRSSHLRKGQARAATGGARGRATLGFLSA
ncbi:hypothetical protein V8G54_023509 [Vigna mungo]|uniref:Sucrose transporter n=1 Tax=Vigna mungo TaxID=3915 RepID=A0AAQ3RRN4_VIGMU